MANIPDSELKIVVVTPDKVILEDRANRVFAPGTEQEIAILPDHTPVYAQLNSGEIRVELVSGQTENIPIKSGVLRVKQNKVSIILGFAE